MNKILREKIQEALSSVLPITLIVLLLSMTITPMPVGTLVLFLAGAVLLIVGMAFFSLGTDVSMTARVSAHSCRRQKILLWSSRSHC